MPPRRSARGAAAQDGEGAGDDDAPAAAAAAAGASSSGAAAARGGLDNRRGGRRGGGGDADGSIIPSAPAGNGGDDDARDLAISMLNDAKMATTAEAKADLLARLEETACRRAPRLLPELMPAVADFAGELAAATRAAAAAFLGAAAAAAVAAACSEAAAAGGRVSSRRPEADNNQQLSASDAAAVVAAACRSLATLCGDSAAAVSKRAAQVASGALEAAFALLSSFAGRGGRGSSQQQQQPQPLLEAAAASLRSAVEALSLDASKGPGPRAAAAKALEVSKRLDKKSAGGPSSSSSSASAPTAKRKAEEEEEKERAASRAAAEDPRHAAREPKRSRWEEPQQQQQQPHYDPRRRPPPPLLQQQPQQQQPQPHYDPRRGPPPPLLQQQQQQQQQQPQQRQQPPPPPPPLFIPPAPPAAAAAAATAAVPEVISVVCSLASRPDGAPQVEAYIQSLPPPLLAEAALACLDRVSSAPMLLLQQQQQQQRGAPAGSFRQKFGALLELAAALRVPILQFNPLLFPRGGGGARAGVVGAAGVAGAAAAAPPMPLPPFDPRTAGVAPPPPPFDPRRAGGAAPPLSMPPPPPFDPRRAPPPPPSGDPRFSANAAAPPPPLPPPATDPRGFPMPKGEDAAKAEPATTEAPLLPPPVVAAAPRPPPKPQTMDASARKKARRLAFERLLASTGISGIGVKSSGAAGKAKAGSSRAAATASSSSSKLLHRSVAAAEFRAAVLARLAARERPGEALGEALLASLKGRDGESDDESGDEEEEEEEEQEAAAAAAAAAAGGEQTLPPLPPLATKAGLGLALRWLTSLFAAEAKREPRSLLSSSSSSPNSSSLPAAPQGGRYETALRATLEALADAVVIEAAGAAGGKRRKRRSKKKKAGEGGEDDPKIVIAAVDPNRCVSRALLEAPSLQLLSSSMPSSSSLPVEEADGSNSSSGSSSSSFAAVAVLLAPLLSRGGTCANVALAAARDVALARPPARSGALGLILDAATREVISVPRSSGGEAGGGNEHGTGSADSFPVDVETRSKAVRLTANRLLPEPPLEVAILERASRELEAGMNLIAPTPPVAAADATTDAASTAAANAAAATNAAVPAADRHIELFCALTTRRPAALLPQLLAAFAGSPKGSPGRAAALRRAPDLARTLGAAEPALLLATTERRHGTLPAGADALLLKMLYAATERQAPPRELAKAMVAVGIGKSGREEGERGAAAAEKEEEEGSGGGAFADVEADARYLPCALAGLPKPEALALLPRLVWLDQAPLRAALSRLLAPSSQGAGGGDATATRLVPAAELLEALATVDGAAAAFAPQEEGEGEASASAAPSPAASKAALVRARKSVDAALSLPGNAFGPTELAAALSRLLVRSWPPPQLFFRVLLQAQAAAPSLRPFVVDVLGQTARRGGLWPAAVAERSSSSSSSGEQAAAAAAGSSSAAWKGWLLAAKSSAPDSFPVLLSLPPRVLASALDPTAGSAAASLRAPLTDYARSRSCPVAIGAETMSVLAEAEAAAARSRLAADMQE